MGDNNPNFIFLIRGPEINKVPKNVVLVCSYADRSPIRSPIRWAIWKCR